MLEDFVLDQLIFFDTTRRDLTKDNAYKWFTLWTDDTKKTTALLPLWQEKTICFPLPFLTNESHPASVKNIIKKYSTSIFFHQRTISRALFQKKIFLLCYQFPLQSVVYYMPFLVTREFVVCCINYNYYNMSVCPKIDWFVFKKMYLFSEKFYLFYSLLILLILHNCYLANLTGKWLISDHVVFFSELIIINNIIVFVYLMLAHCCYNCYCFLLILIVVVIVEKNWHCYYLLKSLFLYGLISIPRFISQIKELKSKIIYYPTCL